MSVLEALLPITATASTRKDGGFSFAANPDPVARKTSASPVDKGLEQDVPKREQQTDKRFAKVLDERIQAEDKEEKRPAKPANEQESEAGVGTQGGNVLPPPGEGLPLQQPGTAASASANPGAEESVLKSSSPDMAEESAGENALTAPLMAEGAAEETHSLQPVADKHSIEQLAANPQTPVSEALSQPASPNSQEVAPSVPVAQEQALVKENAIPADSQKELSSEALAASAAAFTSPADSPDDKTPVPEQGESVSSAVSRLMTSEGSEPAPGQDVPVPSNAGDAVANLVKQDQADRVRAWRGLSLSMPAEGVPTAARADSSGPAMPLAHSGQLQQFAESLRQAVNQEIPAATAAERPANAGTSPLANSASDASAWRAEAAQAAIPAPGAMRTGLETTRFSQVLQGAAFGQPLGERFGNHAWGERLSQRVSMMIGQKISSAQIQLDPPELGAMTIKVALHGDQASVSFHSAHAVVRDALEQSFPRLQEMLGQQGLQLADAQVSDQSPSGQGFAQSGDGRSTGSALAEAEEPSGSIQHQSVQVSASLIDFYA